MDEIMMTLPPADRGRWNREAGEEIWRRKKADDEIRKKEEIIKNSLQPIYWPFGLPGGGAPNAYTNRRQDLRCYAPVQSKVIKSFLKPVAGMPYDSETSITNIHDFHGQYCSSQ